MRGTDVTEEIQLGVNGQWRTLCVEPTRTLLDVLRNHLGLKGTRFGCGLEQCGSCTVLLDGAPVLSCGREIGTVDGREVTTIEGLGGADGRHPLQDAFIEHQAGQCGYCLSGILIRAAALLAESPQAERAEIASALDTHLCRCGAHVRILNAIEAAAALVEEGTR